jgi:non-haem Fe2+, alpha-ketoglutarate-dependent halogenase
VASTVAVSTALTPAQLARYRADGCLFPVPALCEDEARAYLGKVEQFESQYGGPGKWPRALSHKPHVILTWLDALIRHPRILDTVEDIIGPDILCWSSRFFIKDKQDGGFVSWHQDLPYWGLDFSGNILTAWVALTPATRANGVMKVMPGSHRKLVAHKDGAASNLLQRGQEIALAVDESAAVYMELAAGEMSLHHGLIWHGSVENTSDTRRVGYAIRYIAPHVRPIDGLPRDHVTLVRGEDRHGHYDLLPRPSRDLDPAALDLQKKTNARANEIRDLAVRRHRETIASVV